MRRNPSKSFSPSMLCALIVVQTSLQISSPPPPPAVVASLPCIGLSVMVGTSLLPIPRPPRRGTPPDACRHPTHGLHFPVPITHAVRPIFLRRSTLRAY